MRSVRDIGDFNGKTVFVRLDLNAPIKEGKVADDFRLKKYFPLLDFLRNESAKIILASHTDSVEKTLVPVFEYLKQSLPVEFISDYYPEAPTSIKNVLSSGKIVLLENLRKYEEEESNNESFAKHLASFADYYINEAFPVSHRKHASIVGVPKFIPGFAGFALLEEIQNLSKAFNPEHPFVFVLGGAKFKTKTPLLKKFLSKAEKVFVGGALANDLFKARGFHVGQSLVSDGNEDFTPFLNEKVLLPIDLRVLNQGEVTIKTPEDVTAEDMIVDAGPASIEALCDLTLGSRFVLWNGPLGNYELGFKEATETFAKCLSETLATTIVGGGDTVASISNLGLNDKFNFVSAGGGAMLDFLANETLPGIDALN